MASPLRFNAWLRRLQEKGPGPATLFCGPESLLRDQALRELKRHLTVGEEGAHIDHDRFYAGDVPLSQVASALGTVGLFGGRRLVTLFEVERGGRSSAPERDQLLDRLRAGVPGSVFAGFSDLTVRELERKNELTKRLLQVCQVVELRHPLPEEALAWILGECTRRGIRLEAAAGEMLLSKVGPHLQELARELEKLELWAEPGEAIGVDRLSQWIRQGRLGSTWEFCETVLAGRGVESLRAWEAIRNSEPLLRIQWWLQQRARDRLASARGTPELSYLERLLLHTYALEVGIKTGSIPSSGEETALECMLVSLGADRPRGGARIRPERDDRSMRPRGEVRG